MSIFIEIDSDSRKKVSLFFYLSEFLSVNASMFHCATSVDFDINTQLFVKISTVKTICKSRYTETK